MPSLASGHRTSAGETTSARPCTPWEGISELAMPFAFQAVRSEKMTAYSREKGNVLCLLAKRDSGLAQERQHKMEEQTLLCESDPNITRTLPVLIKHL